MKAPAPPPAYNAAAVQAAIGAAYRGQKLPSLKRQAVIHALLKGRG